jgi:hypothetical protein
MESEQINEPNSYRSNQVTAQKQRHGCLTAYLVFMVIANSLVTLMYLLRSIRIQILEWPFSVLIVAGIFNVVCAVALLRWKNWGFWGFAASAVVIFFVNSIRHGIGVALLGFLGLPILYGVLHIGKERKGWSQLD